MGLFDFFKKKPVPKKSKPGTHFAAVMEEMHREMGESGKRYWDFKATESRIYTEKILSSSDNDKVQFILECAAFTDSASSKGSWSSEDKNHQLRSLWLSCMIHLFKTKWSLNESGLEAIAQAFYRNKHGYYSNLMQWPIGSLIGRVEKMVKSAPLSEEAKKTLKDLKEKIGGRTEPHLEKEKAKLIERLDILLHQSNTVDQTEIRPVYFPGEDEFASFANEQIRNMQEPLRSGLFRLLAHVKKTSGSTPSKKFLDDAYELTRALGTEKFKQIFNQWIDYIIHLKEKETQHSHNFNGKTYSYSTHEFIATSNLEMIKGLVWICVQFHDKTTLYLLSSLCERAFKKIPGKGPAAQSIGNACIYTLAKSRGLGGIGQLSRLKMRIKQHSTQNLIDKYLTEAAAGQGVSLHDIEDFAVDDFGLSEGKKEYEFGDYKAILQITGIGRSEIQWFKPGGQIQKSVPSVVKSKFVSKWQKLKDTSNQIDLIVTAQRDRLDRMLKAERKLSFDHFRDFYLQHGLMGFLATKLIWVMEQGDSNHAVILFEKKWVNDSGTEIFGEFPANATFRLWHPALSNLEEIIRWREFMLENKITQPFKQAFRELYLLTDAELNTRTYSNRMASHILKQHQFNSLAKSRGWKYSLLGAFDNGGNHGLASLLLNDYSLQAEYWLNEVNVDLQYNDTGIWNYVSTDQVRFINLQNNETVPLIEIPKLLFSEIMRDVDLFVGVASVGNDPSWQDSGGLPAFRDYWQTFSFGELTELAKTRKAILNRLLPRLKIAPLSEIKDRFLVVKGKLRTYKIHLGSTNILMEPNDQYLCIVPDRGKSVSTENIFLPFEGDNGLSLILSKAFLLASDDTITDPSIVSQLKK
jgi:Domain of unknown function (DUF4132)